MSCFLREPFLPTYDLTNIPSDEEAEVEPSYYREGLIELVPFLFFDAISQQYLGANSPPITKVEFFKALTELNKPSSTLPKGPAA